MHSHVKLQSSWVVLLDLVCLLSSILLAVVLRFGHDEMAQYVFARFDGWFVFVGSILVANYMAGSYRVQYTLSRFNMLVTWLFSMTFAILILSVTSYAWFKILLGRGVLGLAVIFYSVFSLYLRIVLVRWFYTIGGVAKRIAILGHGPADQRLREYLENPFILPRHRLVAWIELRQPERREPAADGLVIKGAPVVEATAEELPDTLTSLNAEMLVLGRSAMWDMSQIYPHLRQVRFSGFEVVTPMDVAEVYCGRIPLNLIDEAETMRMSIEDGFPGMLRLKRVYDLTTAIVGGIIALPLIALAAVLIKLTDPRSPVFYSQERVGRFGKTFIIKKLRTMQPGAESDSGAVWSVAKDPRITTVGKLLRKFRIDELPQFWNVLMGDMSLVGPRPERPDIVNELERQIPFYSEREYALPGVTGWAQIHCPYGNTVEAARRKLEYDLFYIKNMSPSLDLQIMLRTIRTVLFGQEKEP